jgi:hypothetical protein
LEKTWSVDGKLGSIGMWSNVVMPVEYSMDLSSRARESERARERERERERESVSSSSEGRIHVGTLGVRRYVYMEQAEMAGRCHP